MSIYFKKSDPTVVPLPCGSPAVVLSGLHLCRHLYNLTIFHAMREEPELLKPERGRSMQYTVGECDQFFSM